MFKNSLFLKIIMIFTLPALGILSFISILVYEKIIFLDEVYKTKYSLDYLQKSESLIHSLQDERELFILFNQSKIVDNKLKEQIDKTDTIFKDYFEFANNLVSEKKISINYEYIKQIENNFADVSNLRKNIEKFNIENIKVIQNYTTLNKSILESISSIKSIKSANEFNDDFINIFHFLVYKEYSNIQRVLVFLLVQDKNDYKELEKELTKIFAIQNSTFEYFYKNSSIKMLDIYNKNLNFALNKQIDDFVKTLDNSYLSKNENFQNWWELSAKRINLLDSILQKIMEELQIKSQNIQTNAFINQNMSLAFLFISFATLISLLFVLKNIIFKQEVNYKKIEKQKKIYELLNKANKYLIKLDNKKDLYSKINKIILKNENMVFSFIYDLEEDDLKKRIYAEDGELKHLLLSKLDNLKDKNQINMINRAINWKTNILIENFKDKNISMLYKYAHKFDIKSAAAFPIKKFDKITSILLIYSNEDRFFDYEVEILFDKMITDLSHCLEKLDYEKTRLLQENELKISSIAFDSSDPMLITDEKANIIKVNQAFCNVMGYTKDELIGKNPRMFKSLHQKIDFYSAMWSDLLKDNSWSGELYNTNSNGENVPFRVSITAIRSAQNDVINYLGQYIDISEQKDKQKVLEYQATHDILTGLPNRLLLLDRIEHAITKVMRHNIVGGLIFIDLDNFKSINDTLGHAVGDTLLISVSKKLTEVVRDEDTVSRIGGDEFIVLVDNIGNNKEEARSNIEVLAIKIKNALNSIDYIDGHVNISTPSIGVTLFSDSSVSVKDIIKQADTAMYAAKKQGKNSIEFFN